MVPFKNALIACQNCGKGIAVKARDFDKGTIQCTHAGCGHVNRLTQVYYDERILQGIPSFGQLVYLGSKTLTYPLRLGINVVGHAPSCEVPVDRLLHDGKCYISRRHCTIEVLYDKWTGRLRYQVQDGASGLYPHAFKNSLNGTLLNGYLLQNAEKIDLADQGILGLGGKDFYRLEAYHFPPKMLESYLISRAFEQDETQ